MTVRHAFLTTGKVTVLDTDVLSPHFERARDFA